MTAPNDATWPGGYGGFCQIHRLALPCPSCTVPIQPPQPVFIPSGYPVPPVSYPPQPAPRPPVGGVSDSAEPLSHTEYVEMLRGREFTPERLSATVDVLYNEVQKQKHNEAVIRTLQMNNQALTERAEDWEKNARAAQARGRAFMDERDKAFDEVLALTARVTELEEKCETNRYVLSTLVSAESQVAALTAERDRLTPLKDAVARVIWLRDNIGPSQLCPPEDAGDPGGFDRLRAALRRADEG